MRVTISHEPTYRRIEVVFTRNEVDALQLGGTVRCEPIADWGVSRFTAASHATADDDVHAVSAITLAALAQGNEATLTWDGFRVRFRAEEMERPPDWDRTLVPLGAGALVLGVGLFWFSEEGAEPGALF